MLKLIVFKQQREEVFVLFKPFDQGLVCYLRGIVASEDTMLALLRQVHDDDGRKGNDEYYRDTVRHCMEKSESIITTVQPEHGSNLATI